MYRLRKCWTCSFVHDINPHDQLGMRHDAHVFPMMTNIVIPNTYLLCWAKCVWFVLFRASYFVLAVVELERTSISRSKRLSFEKWTHVWSWYTACTSIYIYCSVDTHLIVLFCNSILSNDLFWSSFFKNWSTLFFSTCESVFSRNSHEASSSTSVSFEYRTKMPWGVTSSISLSFITVALPLTAVAVILGSASSKTCVSSNICECWKRLESIWRKETWSRL